MRERGDEEVGEELRDGVLLQCCLLERRIASQLQNRGKKNHDSA